jgi:phosphoadenosine phosphosulfate reductase
VITRDARQFTDTINVGFSCGKDSLVTLDLCRRTFPKVNAYFLWTTPGLSFQDRYLDYIRDRFHVRILKLPHWGLSWRLRSNSFRPGCNATNNCPKLTLIDTEFEVTRQTGCKWFAYGLTRFDSIERNAMLRRCNGLDVKTHRIYPVMHFTRWAMFGYLRQHRIPLPIDYHMFGCSYGGLWAEELQAIKTRFPSDYDKIQTYFPLVEAQILRSQLFGTDHYGRAQAPGPA